MALAAAAAGAFLLIKKLEQIRQRTNVFLYQESPLNPPKLGSMGKLSG